MQGQIDLGFFLEGGKVLTKKWHNCLGRLTNFKSKYKEKALSQWGRGGGCTSAASPLIHLCIVKGLFIERGALNRECLWEKKHLLKGRQLIEHNSNYYSPVLFYIHVLKQHVIYKPETHQIKEYRLRTTALTQQKDQGTWYLETCASNPLQLCTAEKKHKYMNSVYEYNNRAIYARKKSHGFPQINGPFITKKLLLLIIGPYKKKIRLLASVTYTCIP